MSAVMSSAAFDSAAGFLRFTLHRRARRRDLPPCAADERRELSDVLLVREFDDRFGYAKWTFKSCAEWLAWRCGISLSAAREKVRTAQALRTLPEISAAFADGRLSYSKVRALTRVAHVHDEDLLLAYALQATAAQVEERRADRFATSRRSRGTRRTARVVRAVARRCGATKRTVRCGSRSSCRSRKAS